MTAQHVISDPFSDLLREFRGTRILLADDDEFVRGILIEILGDTGLVVDVAEDGNQAAQLATQQAYALILLDLQMPVLDGPGAAQRIRETAPGIPILGISANVTEVEQRRCHEAGMDYLIAKPMLPDTLAGLLLHWLRRGRR